MSVNSKLQDRINELKKRQPQDTIGGNKVQGGSVTNSGSNTGVMSGGDATDVGSGAGEIKGGNSVNENVNKSIMLGGNVHNLGVNQGDVEGGLSRNRGLNNEILEAGSAINEKDAVNDKDSFLQGGMAYRDLQTGMKEYKEIQLILDAELTEIENKNKQIKKLESIIQEKEHQFSLQKEDSASTQSKLDFITKDLDKTRKQLSQVKLECRNKEIELIALKKELENKAGDILKLETGLQIKGNEIDLINKKFLSERNEAKKLREELSDKKNEIKKLKDELENISFKLDTNEQQIDQDNNLVNDKLTQKVELLKNELCYKSEELKEKEKQAAEIKNELQDIRNKRNDLKASLEKEKLEHGKTTLELQSIKTSNAHYIEKLGQLEKNLKVIKDQSENGQTTVTELKDLKPQQLIESSLKTETMSREESASTITAGGARNIGINTGSIQGGNSYSVTNQQIDISSAEINVDVDGKAIEGLANDVAGGLISSISCFKEESQSAVAQLHAGVQDIKTEAVSIITDIQSSFSRIF